MMQAAMVPLCAVPQPAAAMRRRSHFKVRPSLRTLLGLGLLIGLQGMTASPAAVATPSPQMMQTVAAEAVPVVLDSPLAHEPSLFASILEAAFPSQIPLPSLLPTDKESQPNPYDGHHEAPGNTLRSADLGHPPAEAVEDMNEVVAFGSRNVPRWLVHSILHAAHITGVDPSYMVALADVESHLLPDAKAPTSTAEGLFQFVDRTWLEVVFNHAADYGYGALASAIKMVDGDPVVTDEKSRSWIMGMRCDPYFSALMAGELIKDIERVLQSQGERELTEADLYIAHFLGAANADKFLDILDKDPDALAAKLFPKAAKANRNLFTEVVRKKRLPISVAELYDRVDSKLIRRLNHYDDMAPQLGDSDAEARASIN